MPLSACPHHYTVDANLDLFQFPEYQLFEETIEKDIIFGPMNFGVSEEEAKKIAHNVLKTVGLDESF